jgi:hypothetical protein
LEWLTGVNKKEVLKYLGYRGGDVDVNVDRRIDEIEKMVIKASNAMVCHRVLNIETNSPLLFEKTEAVFEGKDIQKHLAECKEAIFMAATLGSGVDLLIRRLSIKDMSDAVICDAISSSAIENVCNNYCAHLEAEYAKKNLYLTDRFSPGYGDLPIENQKFFPDILQTQKQIGLCLNRSMLLEPTKSVTAIIGISEKRQEKRRLECEECLNFKSCNFRMRGVTCYEQI